VKMKNIQLLLLVSLLLMSAGPLGAEQLVDDNGRQVHFSKPFSRIISLYPAHTENLFSLGLDAEIIGVAKGDDFPASAVRDRPRFHYREDAEKFIAARPDLVLVRPMIMRAYPHFIRQLEEAGISVVSLQPTSVHDMYDYWRRLGRLTGRSQEAENMVSAFRQELAALRSRTAELRPDQRKKVYFEAIHRKMKTFMPSSLAVFALESAGGINIAADAEQVRSTNIAYYGKERILAKADDIDVFLAQQGVMNRVSKEVIRREPGFMALKAVRRGEIYIVDEHLVARPTLRLLDGIRAIGAILYPDSFQTAKVAESHKGHSAH